MKELTEQQKTELRLIADEMYEATRDVLKKLAKKKKQRKLSTRLPKHQ